MIACCPRCKRTRGYYTGDAETFGCYICGETRDPKAVVLDVPVPYSKTGEKVTRYCVDCGVPVTGRDTKRCKACANAAKVGDPRYSTTPSRPLGQVITAPRRHDYVSNPKGTGN